MTTPEPTSIENTYRFLKSLMLRRIRHIINSQRDSQLKVLLQQVFSNDWSNRIKTISDIIAQLKQMDSTRGEILKNLLGDTSLSMITNQSRRPADRDIGPAMKKACNDYFGIEIGYLGDVCHDMCVEDSIRYKKPLTIHYNQSMAAMAIEACVQGLIKKDQNCIKRAIE